MNRTDRELRNALLQRHLFTHEAYKSVFRNHPDIVYVMDADGNFRDCNDSACSHFGYSRGEWVNERIGLVVSSEDQPRLFRAFEQAVTGASQQIEITAHHRNGDLLHIDLTLVPAYAEGQVVGVYGFGKNISKRIAMQNEIMKSEIRMNHAQDIAKFGLWEYDLVTKEAAASTQLQQMFGYDHAATNLEEYYDRLHPEDSGRVTRVHESDNLQENSLTEMRIIRPDGQIRTLLSHWKLYRGVEGGESKIYGVFQDISDRKVVEDELRESEKKYRLITENATDLIRVLDTNGTLLYVSPSHRRVLGINDIGMVGTVTFDYIHPGDIECAKQAFSDLLQSKTDMHVRFRFLHAGGYPVWVECVSTPVLGDTGEVESVVVVSRDVTEQVRIEKELRESEDRYYRLQTSLDGFSHDLYGVLTVTEIEKRLAREVCQVLRTSKVSVVQVGDQGELFIRGGHSDVPQPLSEDMVRGSHIPVCEINETPHGYLLKLGENKGNSYFLCISEKPWTLEIPAKQVWLKTIARYVSALYDNFRIIEDLTKETETLASQNAAPSWLLRLLFSLSENERKRLSQDLHDSALQEQIINYRKLQELSTNELVPADLRETLRTITEGLLDVIYQIRITCNELRPPFLREEGLVSSLCALFEFMQRRTNYRIQFDASSFSHVLTDELLIGLYRIIQELLANATKHSSATMVRFTLSSRKDAIELMYEDDGVGVDLSQLEDSFQSMGVYGMKERVRSMDGTICFDSSPNSGLSISISIPASLHVTEMEYRI